MSDTVTTPATRYAIDARGSRITINAYASGLFSAVAHDPVVGVRDFSGEITFAPDGKGAASLHLQISAKSLAVQNDVSEKDRREIEKTMHEQVLETATYSAIVFDATQSRIEAVSEGRYRVDVEGKLTLHGVTRQQRAQAQVFLMGETLRAQGELTLRQTDYNIKPVSVAGGTLKIKDELKLTYELLARKAA